MIEKITIDGWQCIAKKGEFHIGDLCVYFEIDSFLPIKPEFEFLRKSSYRKMGDKEGFKLRTIKLRGTLSQGLALPVSILPEGYIYDCPEIGATMCQDDNVTELLGVVLWDPPVPAQLAGKVKGYFPSFIRKTDQGRVQNLWYRIKDCDEDFEVTVKLDGTSCTYYLNDGKFGVCGRNLELLEDDTNTLWKLARQYGIEDLLRSCGKNIALQGEVIGPGIQSNHANPHNMKEPDFFLFDIWDIDRQTYLPPCLRHAGHVIDFTNLKHVPVVGYYQKLSQFDTIQDILNFANGDSLREGLVFKSNDSSLTFKVISNAYLLDER